MWNVSADFREKVRDGRSRQDFRIYDSTMDNMYLAWSDGDFTADGIEIKRAVNEATDLVFGECPSATLNCKLSDHYGDLIKFWTWTTVSSHNTYLRGQCYIGVQLSDIADPLVDGENCKVSDTIEDTTLLLSGRNGGLYINGEITSITEKVLGITLNYRNYITHVYEAVIYCEEHIYSIVVTLDGEITSTSDVTNTYSSFMKRKTVGKGIFSDKTSVIKAPVAIWQNGRKSTWEWCPVGVYKLYRPRDLWDSELEIKDAYDRMADLDVGLYDTYPAMYFPTTIGQLVSAVCGMVSISGATESSFYDSTPLSRNPFSGNVSCRQVVKWAAERKGRMYYIDPMGTIKWWYPDFDSEPPVFMPTDIEDGSVSLNDYKVPTPDYLEIRTTDERIYTDGTGDVRYVITGNPFYQIGVGTWPTVDTVEFPEYDPCQFGVINADPSYGYGDIFTFIVNDRQGNPVTKMGFVMKETLIFDGRTHAVYESTGNEIREDNQNYGNNTLTTISEKSAEFYSSNGWVGYRLRNYMVLTRIVDISNVDVTYQWGNVYTGDNINPSVPQFQYPVTFIEQPVCVAQMVSSGGSDGWLSTATDFTTQDLKEYTPAYEVNRGTSRTGISFQVHFYVMGLIY